MLLINKFWLFPDQVLNVVMTLKQFFHNLEKMIY